MATAVAMTQCVIMRLDKVAIVRVLQDEPKFAEMFMSYILARNARVEEDLVDQLFNSSEKRLARVLLLMAHFGKEGEVLRALVVQLPLHLRSPAVCFRPAPRSPCTRANSVAVRATTPLNCARREAVLVFFARLKNYFGDGQQKPR